MSTQFAPANEQLHLLAEQGAEVADLCRYCGHEFSCHENGACPRREEKKFSVLDQVIIRRWPGEYTLMGDAATMMSVDEAAMALAQSGFMRPWMAQKVKEALLDGVVFQDVRRPTPSWLGRADGIVSEYRMASREELADVSHALKQSFVSGHALSKRAQERKYKLSLDESEGSDFWRLPRQARVILGILKESGKPEFSEQLIEILLVEKAELLKTKQEPMKIWNFYRRPFIDGGHVVEL